MLIRAIAIIISVLLHAWTGNVLWSLLEKDRPEVINLGEGLDIVLEPRGLIASEVTNVGDSTVALQSLPAIAAVPVPPPLASPPRDAGEQGRSQPPQDLGRVTPDGPSAIAAALPEQLPEVIDSIESKTAAQVAVVQPRQPASPRARDLPPSELDDVITSQQGEIDDDAVPETSDAVPDELSPQTGAVTGRTVAPQQINQPPPQTADAAAPAPETYTEQRVAMAARPVRPEEIKEPAPVVSNRRPDPEALDERRPGTLAQPITPEASRPVAPDDAAPPPAPAPVAETRVATTTAPQPPEPVAEQAPETIEVIAQPQQIVIVTELSSGEEKTGGDATQAGLYLGRISEQVQRAKVNPRSRMTGTAIVKFTVGIDGRLLSKEVSQSSGFPVLDDAAITTLDRAAPFPPIPPDVSKTPMTFQQPFKFVVR